MRNRQRNQSNFWLPQREDKERSVRAFEDQDQDYLALADPRANGAKRRSGRKPGARVTNSARLFTPGKKRTQRSAKFINDCGRITLAHGWTHWVDLTDLKNMAERQEWKGQRSQRFKKIYVRKITQHEEKFFQLSLKGMIRFDLNMEHDEVYGKFVLTICICILQKIC